MTQLTHFLKIRVTRDQYERLLFDMSTHNCKTISQYIRDISLYKTTTSDKIIFENNKMLKDILKILQGEQK